MIDIAPKDPFPLAPTPEMPHPAPATPSGDVLVESETVGGPRHYKGQGLGPVGAWKCPACGVENSGLLDNGCVACGAGSVRARHVGVPPSRVAPSLQSPFLQPVDSGFQEWVAPYASELSPRMHALLADAWSAAIRWYQGRLKQELRGGETAAEPTPTLTTVAVPRQLLAQVIQTLETTFDLPDEQQSNELIALLAALKEIYG
jgi:hypothetical protein